MAANNPLRSRNNDVPSYVSFFNRTNRTVTLFWVNYEGKLLRYARLPPFKGTAMNTFVTHPWIVRDAKTGYPLLMNGKPVFHPAENTQEGMRTLIWIHIPVFSLLRRALEIVFIHFDQETVMQWDMPATLKELLKKISPITEFGNYRFFEDVTYHDIQQLGFQADWLVEEDADSDEEENEADNEDNDDSSSDSDAPDYLGDDDDSDDGAFDELFGHGNAVENDHNSDESEITDESDTSSDSSDRDDSDEKGSACGGEKDGVQDKQECAGGTVKVKDDKHNGDDQSESYHEKGPDGGTALENTDETK